MGTVIIARDHEERWALVHALGVDPSRAYSPEVARARLTHPSTEPASVILQVVRDEADLSWLRWHRAGSTRPAVPVVALADGDERVEAAAAAGADHVEPLRCDDGLVARLAAAIDGVALPESQPAAGSPKDTRTGLAG